VEPALVKSLGLTGPGGVVSLVGGGGKTTLMFRLARELADSGCRVLTTTTTKIFRPDPDQSPHLVVDAEPDGLIRRTRALMESGCRHMTAVQGFGGGVDKLVGLPRSAVTELVRHGGFDWILVEADGAKRRPLKAPAAHEPVVPAESTVVTAVVGLEAIDRPLAAPWVFRCKYYSRITGLSEAAAVTLESVACVLTHPQGMMKGAPEGARRCVFLNKADNRRRLVHGRKLAKLLTAVDGGPERVVVGALRDSRAVRLIEIRGNGKRSSTNQFWSEGGL